jgi:LPS-assembly protein
VTVSRAWPACLVLLCFAPAALADGGVCTHLGLVDEAPALGEDDPALRLNADRVDFVGGGLSSLTGAVELRQGNKVFRTEALEFEDQDDRVRVRARSIFRNPQLIIRSESADFDLAAESGVFSATQFHLVPQSARGGADRIRLATDGSAELDAVRYTTCAPEAETWFLQARQIRLDTERGLGTARHARIHFARVPIVYLPYFQFPIDDRRRSGLLFPTFGQSDRTGTDLRWPVYLNLGPNYDATVTPRLMSQRGLQITTQGRYLLPQGEGRLGYELLGSDTLRGGSRSYVYGEHLGLINDRLAVDARYAEISDRQYFEDLGGDIDLAAITHLERSARLTYQAPGTYTLTALVQDYQTVVSRLDPIDEPYRRLPQLQLRALTRDAYLGARAGLRAEHVNFARSDSVEGQRVDLRPFLRYENDQLSRYLVAEVDYRHTAYQLTGVTAEANRQPTRSLYSLGAETGLRFDRLTPGGRLQTLEPRAFYLYVPFVDQSRLPLFDSGEPDFDFTQLFARNRFSGEDRVSDAHHLAVAATSRLLDPETGVVRWSASVGQLYRLQAPRVDLPGLPTPDSGPTDFIASFDYRLSSRLSSLATAQWSPDEERFDRTRLALRYRHPRADVLMGYRYREGLLEQGDIGMDLPLAGGFSAVGRWRYSLQDQQSLDLYTGIGYESCCWALRTSYRRFIAGTDGRYDSGVYLQLELKGLTRIGGGTEPFSAVRGRAAIGVPQ